MKRAYCYLRVSSQNQIDGYGFDRQEEAVRAYATVGEVRNALEDVFGEYRLPPVV